MSESTTEQPPTCTTTTTTNTSPSSPSKTTRTPTTNTSDADADVEAEAEAEAEAKTLLKTVYPSIAASNPAIPIMHDEATMHDWTETRFADTYMDRLDRGYAFFRGYAPGGKARPVAVCGVDLVEMLRVRIEEAEKGIEERRGRGELFGR